MRRSTEYGLDLDGMVLVIVGVENGKTALITGARTFGPESQSWRESSQESDQAENTGTAVSRWQVNAVLILTPNVPNETRSSVSNVCPCSCTKRPKLCVRLPHPSNATDFGKHLVGYANNSTCNASLMPQKWSAVDNLLPTSCSDNAPQHCELKGAANSPDLTSSPYSPCRPPPSLPQPHSAFPSRHHSSPHTTTADQACTSFPWPSAQPESSSGARRRLQP